MKELLNAAAPNIEYTRVSELREVWYGVIEYNNQTGLWERWERPNFELSWELKETADTPAVLLPLTEKV